MKAEANNGQCLNLVYLAQATLSTVILTLLDTALVHHRYLPNNVGTHLQPSLLKVVRKLE